MQDARDRFAATRDPEPVSEEAPHRLPQGSLVEARAEIVVHPMLARLLDIKSPNAQFSLVIIRCSDPKP